MGNEKQKELIKVSKINDAICHLWHKEVLVSISDDVMNLLDNECIGILLEQEINKITLDKEGKVKLVKDDFRTSSSMISKYGLDKIARANKVQQLTFEQQADLEAEKQGFLG